MVYRVAGGLAILYLIFFPFTIGNLMQSKNAAAQKGKNENNSDKVELSNTQIDHTTNVVNTAEASTAENHPHASMRVGYVDLTNTGTLFISSGTVVSSEGSFITSATGTTENRGDLYLKGDWTNNGTYTTSTGKIFFWGPSAISVGGTNLTTVYNAEVNNSSPGGVTLQGNMVVSNTLTLTSGKLDLNSKTLTISNAATAGIAYTSGYIYSEKTTNASKVQWNIGSTTGAHIIPFGTSAGVLIPLTINLTAGTIGNVTASTYPTAADNKPYPVSPDSVLHVRNNSGTDNSANMVDRYWQIDKSGASGTATITFTYADAEVPAAGEASLAAQRYSTTGKGWNAAFPSQTANSATNTVTAPAVTTFGPFAIASSATPLPIELISFEAILTPEKTVHLKWSTASELNNDFFTIERMNDDQQIEIVKTVKGAGNSSIILNYETYDEHPMSGVSYYRLKQTDFDGKFDYSEWESIHLKDELNTEPILVENVYPNPFNTGFKVDFTLTESGEVSTELINNNGQLVANNKLQGTSGFNSFSFDDVADLPPGVYYLRMIFKESIQRVKLVKN
jgi:hypothetical protein